MAATAQLNLSGLVSNLPTGSKNIGPLTLSSAAAVASEQQIVLASGANTITKPTGATICIIVFDPTSAVAKTLKGVTGDTGIPVGPTGFQVVTPTGSSFCLTSASADTGCTTTIIWL